MRFQLQNLVSIRFLLLLRNSILTFHSRVLFIILSYFILFWYLSLILFQTSWVLRISVCWCYFTIVWVAASLLESFALFWVFLHSSIILLSVLSLFFFRFSITSVFFKAFPKRTNLYWYHYHPQDPHFFSSQARYYYYYYYYYY